MSGDLSQYTVFLLALLLGIRHGIDWDHIAAITDVTGSSSSKRSGFVLGFLYIVGHAAVVIFLGFLAILIGINLPDWVDPLMERIVGITLVGLGFWLVYSIYRRKNNFRLKSRWMIIIEGISKLSFYLHNKIPHSQSHEEFRHTHERNLFKGAFIVGLIHGVGVETPSQILLFVTAAGLSHTYSAVVVLFVFVLGLILSNTLISIFSVLGYAKVKKNSNILLVLGFITGLFSIIIGLQLLL